ncbi:MAG: hypothetical protein ACOQNY_01810 [Mycoplasmoidaceae bacterium]
MKLIKTLLLTGCAAPAIVVPMTTMTSCSQSWGSARPLSIGSTLASGGPYSAFSGNHYDFDHKNMLSYLQSNYSVQPSGNNYAYSLPMKFVDEVPDEHGEWVEGSAGWYTSGDSHLISYATDKWKEGEKTKKEIVFNAQNAALATNTNFISSIGSAIKSFIELALQYQAQQVSVKDENQTNLNIAWGTGANYTFNHGTKGDSTNQNFFELDFALSNLLGASVAKAIMRSSSINFHFKNSTFPLPEYKATGDFTTTFANLLEGHDGTFEPESTKYYSSKHFDKDKTDKDNPLDVIDYVYDYVPVIVTFDDLTTTYLNPTNTDENGKSINSFIVSDYYSSKNQILSTIGNSWEKANYKKFVGDDIDAKPTKQAFALKAQSSTSAESSQDARLGSLSCKDFVVLLSYSVRVYVKETTPGSGTWILDDEHADKNRATMNKIQNIFPAFFNKLYGDEIYKEYTAKKDGTPVKIFDQSKVNKKLNNFLGLLSRTNSEGWKKDLTKLSEDSKKLLTFLGCLFGSDTSINTNEFITATDLPQD